MVRGSLWGRIGGRLDNAVAVSLFAHCQRKALKEIPDNVVDLRRGLSSCFHDGYNTPRVHGLHWEA